jgi:glycosyltransferase involved in cell wall biosynthesis
MNEAIARSSGRFLCILAGDDVFEPTRIERQLACFLVQPDQVAVVYSDMSCIDAQGLQTAASYLEPFFQNNTPASGDVFEKLWHANFMPSPAAMTRRAAMDAVGGYDETLYYDDFDMWLRLARRFHFAYLPATLVRYRILATSMSHAAGGIANMRESQTDILRKWIGVGLAPELEQRIGDMLWANAKLLLSVGRYVAARKGFALAAQPEASASRKLTARLVQLPGACVLLRTLGLWSRRLRGLPTEAAV